ncbi:hypothetical protein NP493_33g00019 [Ridgeia piscesae]|uniref:Uncharacterized protein n=1 Tax=Ridgeia piscesae TaxID=27915 RepID=A0AAD9UJY8_RIDPI|nr:hypothetical protein NP493_33g00019 [Ridgeia piscesae]
MVVLSSFLAILVLSATVVETSTAQLTNTVGSTSVSVNPTDATCGRVSADTYCRVDISADVGCVVHTCRTACEDRVSRPTYTDLLRDVSGFNYDGSVTNTTKDFGDGNTTVAVFNKATRDLNETHLFKENDHADFFCTATTLTGCDALGFLCRDGERKEHPKYCDEYYFCEKGKYIHKKCFYPDRWSVEHKQCERFRSVSCGKRIPKNHPCDREINHVKYGPPHCNTEYHPANCTGRKDGLYYESYGDICGVYGCMSETLVTLKGTNLHMFGEFNIPDSPYLWCTDGETSLYRYDCRKYWRCRSKLWVVETCPGRLMWSDDRKRCVSGSSQCGNRWFPETDANVLLCLQDNLSHFIVSEIKEIYNHACTKWRNDAHPIDYVVDSDSSTFWLSRAHLHSVDLLFDLRGTYKLEEVSMTFFGPVPLVVSIFKKETMSDSWHLWRDFRDICRDASCTQLGHVWVGGQCTCKRYVTGRRCDRCLPGYRNIRQSDPDGCYKATEILTQTTAAITPMSSVIRMSTTSTTSETTAAVDQKMSPEPEMSLEPEMSPEPDSPGVMTTSVDYQAPETTSNLAAQGSSTPWLLYTTPIYVVVVIIIIIIAVICVRSRRQHRGSGIR